jgi:aryl-alcohol dehydrogenase (NADP+)
LGASGLTVSEICLGTMTWGEQNNEAQAHAQLEWALAHGIDFVDTAEMYPVPPRQETQGRTETLIGNWIARHRGRRGEFTLASKIAGPGRRDWIRNGDTQVSAKTIAWAIDDSLKRLQTDYIDLYQIHWPERYLPLFGNWAYDASQERAAVPMLEQLEAMARAIQAGKIRAWGLSNETCFGVCEFVRLAHQHGLPPPASIQNCYNLLSRTFDGDLAEASHQLRVPLLAYSPLAMGMLAGKYRDGAKPAAARLTLFENFGERYRRPRAVAAAEEYCNLADRHSLAPASLALAFVRERAFTASTIIGATSIAQLDELAAAFSCALSAEVKADIEAVHRLYPNPTTL